MKLVVNNRAIHTPLIEIIKDIKAILHNGKLETIEDKGSNIRVTCPCKNHKNGREKTADCEVYVGESNDNVKYGFYHCFSCGSTGPFDKFVSECFECSIDKAREWLVKKYGAEEIESRKYEFNTSEIVLGHQTTKNLDESVLNTFEDWHPYMAKRKLSKEICERFKVKYDNKSECLVFPVWNAAGHLKFLTRRSVKTKMFLIPEGVEKPVYLLNYIKAHNIKDVVICESQINALYCWSNSIPAVALFGTGSKEQYNILNKSGIRHVYLALDGDAAGVKGTQKLKENLKSHILVDVISIPQNKDVNDLNTEEIDKLFKDVPKISV